MYIHVIILFQVVLHYFYSARASRPVGNKQSYLRISKAEQSRLIPDRLVMNHRVNLLEHPDGDSDRAMNVKRNLDLFPDIKEVEFLDDSGCISAIEDTHSKELAQHFSRETIGMYKSDICRLAQLAKHGGYYFDTDLEMLHDMRDILPPQVSFASVIALPWKGPRNPNEIFQAFIGAAPGHPVITRSMDKCLEYYTGHNETLNSIMGKEMKGTTLMRLAYEDWVGDIMRPGVREHHADEDFSHSFLFEEERMNQSHPEIRAQQGRGNNCNIGIVDKTSQKALAYSHSVGKSTSCHAL